MNAEQLHVEALKRFFSAQRPLDIDALVATLADDVIWHVDDEPNVVGTLGQQIKHGGPRRGRQQVREFFESLGNDIDFVRSDLDEFIAQGDKVVVLGSSTIRVRLTNVTAEEQWAVVFTFRDGLIAACRAYDKPAKLTAPEGQLTS